MAATGTVRVAIERTATAVRSTLPPGFRGSAAAWGVVTILSWASTALPAVIGAAVSRAVGAPGAPPALFAGMTLAFAPFGVFGTYLILWAVGGSEQVVRDRHALILRRSLLGVPLPRRVYAFEHVGDLRVSPHPYLRAWNPWTSVMAGTIAFDYGASTHRFGAALEAAEAARLVTELLEPPAVETAPPARTVRVPEPRYRLSEHDGRFCVTMPYDYRLIPRPLWIVMGWIPLSALFVTLGIGAVSGSIVPVLAGALVSALVAVSFVGMQALLLRLYEIIEVDPEHGLFERRVEFWGLRSSGSRLSITHVSGLRIDVGSVRDVVEAYTDMARRRSGPIAFEFGEETNRIGMWVSEAEAAMVVAEILERFPALGRVAAPDDDAGVSGDSAAAPGDAAVTRAAD